VRGTRDLFGGGDGDLCDECDHRRVRTAGHVVGRACCHEAATGLKMQPERQRS
jgi:hypothetical protein